jgi:hypothetical protein
MTQKIEPEDGYQPVAFAMLGLATQPTNYELTRAG